MPASIQDRVIVCGQRQIPFACGGSASKGFVDVFQFGTFCRRGCSAGATLNLNLFLGALAA
jgi:hypothetical protein